MSMVVNCEAEHGYEDFRRHLQERFAAREAPFFTTGAEGLFQTFLDNLPYDRQHYNCRACQRFFERYGGLVTIGEDGRILPALWHEEGVPDFFKGAAGALARLVSRAKVTGVFLSAEKVWGQPVTGAWTHFAVTPPAVHTHPVLTAGQAVAEKLEDYRNVQRALAEFTPAMLDQALRLLESEALYRSEKVIGPARWLRDLHRSREGLRGPARDNATWRAVATAPAGFCHPRSSMVGTLLEDLAAGMDFAEVSRRFAAKMHPLQYQRPQAAPSAGNIAAAEKLVEKLGIARSLERRFARLDEVEAIWRPRPATAKAEGGGVFGHLVPKGETPPAPLEIPSVTMTWEKFRRLILPSAESIEYLTRTHNDRFSALVTAAHPDAPPILQWDLPERRNPVSWYIWNGGSPASQWGLPAGRWVPVAAISLKPSQWGPDPEAFPHQGQGVFLVLEGARETRNSGNALFPEILKAELREARSTIEAYSRSAKIGGAEEASACGILLGKGEPWNAHVRVRMGSTVQDYRLDRWD